MMASAFLECSEVKLGQFLATVHDSDTTFWAIAQAHLGDNAPKPPFFLTRGLGPFGPSLAKEGGTGQSPVTGKHPLSCMASKAL